MTGDTGKINILVIGAGKAGELIAGDILERKDSPFNISGFVDDDKEKQGQIVATLPVLGRISNLKELVKKHDIEELIIAIPSERGKSIRKIVKNTMGLKLVYKILPRLSEVLLQEFDQDYLKYIRRVRAEDLLGGEILKSDQAEISSYTKDQTILITGAAGSIGSELSRQVVAHGAKKVILYDWWENGMFDLCNQLVENYPNVEKVFIIGDIKDRKKLDSVIKVHRPSTIFHAAAYKHVPLMEHNPAEAVKNNILGTKNVAELAIKYKVEKFVLVSTDKAVNPTNIMGATKRAAEKVIHILAESQSTTIFCAVRFGNVINSNGSAIPFFEKQIEKGGPITVTHKDMTRFFMTIPEAAHLILQSWIMGQDNDLFVLDMGESIKIYDLVKLLITLHGYIPNKEVKIEIIGLRPGEKLYEEVLVSEEETKSTSVKKIFRTKNYLNFDKLAFIHKIDVLSDSIQENSLHVEYVREKLELMVSTYKPNKK